MPIDHAICMTISVQGSSILVFQLELTRYNYVRLGK